MQIVFFRGSWAGGRSKMEGLILGVSQTCWNKRETKDHNSFVRLKFPEAFNSSDIVVVLKPVKFA